MSMHLLDQISFFSHSSSIFQGERVPLHTVKVVQPQLYNQVKQINNLWKRHAKSLVEQASEFPHFFPQLPSIRSSISMSEHLSCRLSQPLDEESHVYVAYDVMNKVQAMALVSFKGYGAKLHYLLTNPINLEIHGLGRQIVRGAGTAVLRHIAKDTLENPICVIKELSLMSTDSAKPFYEKLNFVPDELCGLVLLKHGVQRLVQNAHPAHAFDVDDVAIERFT